MAVLFCIFQARDPQQEAKEELENLKKQHDLLKRMLQQQEQLKALQGRQAALLALQHKAEQAIAVMDDSGMWNDSICHSYGSVLIKSLKLQLWNTFFMIFKILLQSLYL